MSTTRLFGLDVTIDFGSAFHDEGWWKHWQDATPFEVRVSHVDGHPDADPMWGCFPFTTGSAITDDPAAHEVLACIFSDGFRYRHSADQAEFLYQYGYCDSLESVRRGIGAWGGCKRAWEFIDWHSDRWPKGLTTEQVAELLDRRVNR